MIEAVGEQFWPKYFSQLRDRLLPGGLAGIQAITIQDSLFQAYRREVDFIQRYVFPGGMLPSPQILKTLGERFGERQDRFIALLRLFRQRALQHAIDPSVL